jgi:hypothetical protein
MKIIDYKLYSKKVEKLNDRYWLKSKDVRWNYMIPVIETIKEIKPKTAVELGTYKISLMDFSDSMALEKETIDPDNLKNKVFIFDASKTPWKIKDKEYDLFVALQVLEHLGPNQKMVFQEIKRICNYAIISLPYKWNCPDNPKHHMIDDDKISIWTDNLEPIKKQIKSGRIILTFKF